MANHHDLNIWKVGIRMSNFKHDIISAFDIASSIDTPLIIQTHYGFINGNLLKEQDLFDYEINQQTVDLKADDQAIKQNPTKFLESNIMALSEFYRERAREDDHTMKGIWLKDARITIPGQPPFVVPLYCLFLDQVIGVTYGELTQLIEEK